MIEIHNNFLKVKSTDNLFKAFQIYFRVINSSNYTENDEIIDLYTIDKNGDMIIPPGFDMFIPDSQDKVDMRVKVLPEPLSNIDFDELAIMSDKVVLRDDQILAIKKMIYLKNGLLQLPTGIGKSEIIAGFLKCIRMIVGHDVPTIILEPTVKLVTSTVERFNKYGIKAKEYSDCRGTIDGIIITHPMSLLNDLKKNNKLFDSVKIFIADECQHLQSDSWSTIVNSLPVVEYRLGLSALVIDPDKVPITTINKLDYSELMAIGGTGNILMEMKPSFYIDNKVLATPILFRINHSADEWIRKDLDWHQIRKHRLESDSRTNKIAKISSYLANSGYKSLILVGTKNHAYRIMEMINNYGLGDYCRCTFGGETYYKWDEEESKPEKCKDEDTYSKFEEGEFRIFIGTSHIYEGADIPNLDVIIPCSIGKQSRRVIQGVGRALRKSKKSKHGYAYIIDFTDHNCLVLSKHSRERYKIYTNTLGITKDRIYNNITFEKFKEIFHDLEA